MRNIQLRHKAIGYDHPAFVIAEIGVNHNGDIALARKLVDAAEEAGVDAVKFQTFKADKLVTAEARQATYQTENTGKEESQYEMLKNLELPYEAFAELKKYSEDKGMTFMSTPFDVESADFLNELDVEIFKVGSGELTNHILLEHIARTGKPMIISTGMAVLNEIASAINVVDSTGNKALVVLQCTTNYPCPPEDVNLKAMQTLQAKFNRITGYSDHTAGIIAPVAAVAMGARVIEKHYTLDRTMPGPDHKASLEPGELREMMRQIRLVETMMGSGEKKPSASEAKIAEVARKSLVASTVIAKGTRIERDMLEAKRPGTGISPSRISEVVGRTAIHDISIDEVISWDQLSPTS